MILALIRSTGLRGLHDCGQPMSSPGNQKQYPLVSTVIPCFNFGPYVGEAIQSVLDQDYRPLEIIVCDDGSTDNTAEVLSGFGDQIIAVRGEHRGVSAARNMAMKRARGDFIAFLDADDRWLPGKLRAQMDAMLANPQAAVCHTGYGIFGAIDAPGPVEAERMARAHGRCFDEQFASNCVGTSAALVRRSAMPPWGFEEDLTGGEDYALFLHMLFDHEAIYLPQVLLMYRRHDGQTTSDGNRRIQVQAGVLRMRFLDRFKDRIEPGRYESMRKYVLDDLKVQTYSRYWTGDWANAARGFATLARYGCPMPMRHRVNAWIRAKLARKRR